MSSTLIQPSNQQFIHETIEFPKIKQVTLQDGVRHYETPTGNKYQSVTTFLKSLDQEFLAKWKARVGQQEAARVAKRASARGRGMHAIVERLLLNEPNPEAGETNYVAQELYQQVKPHLVNNVTKVYGIEAGLFSNIMKLAGTADLVCEWQNVDSIVDFKTSIRTKKLEWVEKYFLQCAAYSVMVEELVGKQCKQLVVVIGIEEESAPQIFVQPRLPYVKRLFELLNERK